MASNVPPDDGAPTEQRELSVRLGAGQAELAAMLVTAGEAVARLSLDGHCEEWIGAPLFGLEPHAITGLHAAEWCGEVAAQHLLEQLQQVALTGEPLTVENVTPRPHGVVYTLDRLAPLREAEGAVQHVLWLIRDITPLKRATETARRADRLEATATLAAGLAHEFNNLMAVVLGNAELLRSQWRDSSDAGQLLGDIASAARRAGELAQQMLSFARGGKYELAEVSLDQVVDEALSRHLRLVPPRVRLERIVEPELWPVEGDRVQLQQVMVNLLVNAIESIEGHGRVIITTRNAEIDEHFASVRPDLVPGRYAYLSVEDTGHGMDPITLSRAFEPFFTTRFPGRGLGLAAVYGIVRNHGGYISAYSEPQLGTTVKIYLPVRGATPPDLRHVLPGGSETILVIDDDPLVLSLLDKTLSRLGYRVLLARHGDEAVEMARNFGGEIHLVLLDLRMPVLSGADTFHKLRSVRPGLPVVLCSGYELDHEAQRLLDDGAVAFVQKPFRLDQISKLLRDVLQPKA